MAHYAQNDQPLGILNLTKNVVRFFQIFTIFYAFFGLVYWLLYTSQVPGITNVFWIFKPSWDFIGIFYSYKPVAGTQSVDFTGVISSVIMILISNLMKSLHDFLDDFELNYKVTVANKPKKDKASAKTATATAQKTPKDTTSFIFILDVQITNVSNFIQEEKLSPEAVDELKKKFHEALLHNLNQNRITQKGYFKKKLYLIYKDFDYIDNFIFYTRETLNALSREFSKPTLRIDFLVSLGRLRPNDDFMQEINILDTILCLNLKNEFVTTAGFRNLYEERTKRQYKNVTKGIYNLSKNLNVNNNQEIFSLKENL